MTIKERLLQFIEAQKISRSSFERAAGLSYGYIAAMRKGLGAEKLDNVLRAFPNLNRDWLLYGEGEMIKSNSPTNTSATIIGESIQHFDNSPNSGNNSNNTCTTDTLNKALDEIAAQRRVTEQTQSLLQEAQTTIREMTATNSKLTAQLLSLFHTIQTPTT